MTQPSKNTADYFESDPAQVFGFNLKSDGLYTLGDEDEESLPIFVCGHLAVMAWVRSAESAAWGKLIVWSDPDGNKHDMVLPQSALQGDGLDVRKELAERGLNISSSLTARRALNSYLTKADPEARARIIIRTGWQDLQNLVYALPSGIAGQAHEKFIFSTDLGAAGYAIAGTDGSWTETVGTMSINNSRLQLGISMAFASILMNFSSAGNGGINLVGPSSCGKTTIAAAAASVFGNPKYIQSWRTTDNGLEGVATSHNHSLLVLDELGQVDPRKAGEIVYMLGNGAGKQRASKVGTARDRARWDLLFLSTGEVGLTQHMALGGLRAHAGQEVRLVDLDADAGAGFGAFDDLHGFASGATFSDTIRTACGADHGAVGIAFAEKCISHAQALTSRIAAHQNEFMLKAKAELGSEGFAGQVARVCERFALIGFAGELATEWGLTQWPAGQGQSAALRCFCEWGAARGSTDNAEPQAIVETLTSFLIMHGESRFSSADPPNADSRPQQVHRRAGWFNRNPEDSSTDFMIEPKVFEKEIFAGMDIRGVRNVLAGFGYLATALEGGTLRYTIKQTVDGGAARPRLYTVRSKIFDYDPTKKQTNDPETPFDLTANNEHLTACDDEPMKFFEPTVSSMAVKRRGRR
jgi:putative DNA primase/helicase